MSDTEKHVPAGFRPCHFDGQFNQVVGDVYRRDSAQRSIFGLHVDERHTNPNGVLHGGVLVTLMDTVMGQIAEEETGRVTTTITLNIDFAAGVTPPAWIEAYPTIVRLTRSLCFMRGEVREGANVLLSATGIWRVFDKQVERGKA